jgi:hemolysin activation/secretion protein
VIKGQKLKLKWLAAIAALLSLPGYAQVTPGAGGSLRSFEPPSDATPPSRLEIPVPDVSVMTQKLAGKVTRFRLSGLTTVSEQEAAVITTPWTDRALTPSDLTAVLHAVRLYLRQRGLYAADAYFPEQTVVDGIVEITVLEGRIGAIHLDAENTRLKRAVAESYLSRLQFNSLIERGGFDTALLLLNDLPGVRVIPSLTPGSNLGYADLQVRLNDEPAVAGYLQLDNHEIRELGEYRLTGHLRLRNPLGIGDLVTAQFTQTHTSDRKLGALSYSLPVGSWGTRIGARVITQHYRLGGDFETLEAHGRHAAGQLTLTHPFVRTNDRNLTGALQLQESRFNDYIDAVSASNKIRHRMATLNIFADRSDNFLRGGITLFQAQYRKGHVYLDTPGASAADAAGLGVGGRFERGRIRLEREHVLSEHTGIAASMLLQIASGNLDNGLKLQLGGPDGVRAYGLSELFVDQGHLARINYRYTRALGEGWRARAALFADSARGHVNKNALPGNSGNRQSLTGYGVSLAVSWRDTLVSELTLAWPATTPATDTHRHMRIWASLRHHF